MPLKANAGTKASWRTDVHAHGVQVSESLAGVIDDRLQAALAGLESRVHRVHLRLYGGPGWASGCTCYIRVDLLPSGGLARGDSAADVDQAVAVASVRVGAAVRELFRGGLR
ncbi:MAG TPA: hypothetical protein VFM88_18930 [Vicinamibacteria bacterium]|nr:hypothetical protein [Vicinamibacteria bacterium]